MAWPKGVPAGWKPGQRKRGIYVRVKKPSFAALREARGLSVAQLAERLGLTEAEVRSVERQAFIIEPDLRARWHAELDPEDIWTEAWNPPFKLMRRRAGIDRRAMSKLLHTNIKTLHWWEIRNAMPKWAKEIYVRYCEAFARPGGLREWRVRARVNMEDASTLMNMCRQTYAKVEQSESELTAKEYVEMERVLKMSGAEARRAARALRGGR